MEDNQTGSADQASNSVTDSGEEKRDTVAYETYSRTLGESKKRQQKLLDAESKIADMEAKLSHYELQEKEKAGKYEEVIQELKSKLSEKESALGDKDQRYAYSSVSSKIREVAIKHGCKNPEKLLKLMGKEDWKSFNVDSNFQVDSEQVEQFIEQAKRDHADIQLFKTADVTVNDKVPTNNIDRGTGKELNKMSINELLSMAESLDRRK